MTRKPRSVASDRLITKLILAYAYFQAGTLNPKKPNTLNPKTEKPLNP